MKVIALVPIEDLEHVLHAEGETFELPDECAKKNIGRGYVAAVAEEPKSSAPKATKKKTTAAK